MSEESSSSWKNSPRMCGLCDKNPSKYCCPRCEAFYCSLDCYKSEKHMNCAESFYRDCVTEELGSNQIDEESRRKMVDILKKMHENDEDNPDEFADLMENCDGTIDSDDEEVLGLHERVEGLNLDDADAVWKALTEDERNEFKALLNQGDISALIPQWEPWWGYSKEEKLIEKTDSNDKVEEEMLKKCPPLKSVEKLSSLTTVQPSPAIKFNITNVLASYAFVTRYFNGELDPVETAIYLLNVSANLDTNANFEDVITAMESVAQKCVQSDLIETDELSLEVMKHDTFLILQGPSKENKLHYCKAALAHIHRILSEARAAKKTEEKSPNENEFSKKFPEHKSEHLPKLDSSKVKKCLKKIEYYLAFVESCGMEFR